MIMEMLNNILFTENARLVSIITSPLLLVESYLSLCIFINMLNIKCNRKQKLLYVLFSSFCSIISNIFIPPPFNLIFNYLIFYAIIYFVFKKGLVKSLVALFLPVLIFGIVNVLILNIYIKFLNITYDQAESVPAFRLLYLLIVYSVVFIVVLILKNKNLKINVLEDLDKKTKKVLALNFALGLFTILFQAIILFYYIDFAALYVTFLNFIVLLLYFCINLYSLNRITQLIVTTRDLETSEAYNKSITALYDNVKGFKHDFDNIVSAIGGYVETNDMEGLKGYYHSLRDDCQKSNNIATLNPNIINNPAIYSILCSKYHKADSLGIKINLEFFVDLNEFNINPYAFSRILGILLDNAIEAASECKEKLVNIYFRNENSRNRNIVIISNTYKDKSVNTEEIFEKGKTGKENHSGLGLWEIRKYLSKNNHINLYTTKNDKYFIQQLEIYYDKK